MIRTLALCLTLVALTITLVVVSKQGGAVLAANANTDTFVPPCPQARQSADGNMSPLFCVIDNPAALRFYAPLGRQTFALGSNAGSSQVVSALIADYNRHATEPELCAVYRLAAWRERWHFGFSVVGAVSRRLNFPSVWCREPSFPGVD
jgi:hypothetical protein